MNSIKIKHEKLFFFPLVLILFFSCKTTDVAEQPSVIEEESVVEEEPIVVIDEVIINDETIIEEPTIEEVIIQEEEPIKEYHEEYSRSLGDVKDTEITIETFIEDKESILSIINNLYKIMEEKDYKKWIGYISPESLEYWQKPNNLRAVSSRLPVKGYTLKSLEDYFRMIFIPSRLGIIVHEIRYITTENVKVVQVKDNHDIICYYFEKVKGRWMLVLDTLE